MALDKVGRSGSRFPLRPVATSRCGFELSLQANKGFGRSDHFPMLLLKPVCSPIHRARGPMQPCLPRRHSSLKSDVDSRLEVTLHDATSRKTRGKDSTRTKVPSHHFTGFRERIQFACQVVGGPTAPPCWARTHAAACKAVSQD